MLCFPRMDNPVLTIHPQSDVCWLCKQHFKSKEKVSTKMSVGFKIFKKNATKWTAVEKGPSSFQNFHLNLDKCNKITAELLENETVKCHPQCRLDFTHIKTTNKIKISNFNRNHSRATARRTFKYENAP